jgi:cyanate lyase
MTPGRRRRGCVGLIAAAVFSLAPAGASAQTVKERLDLTREAVESQRRVPVSGSLLLSEPSIPPPQVPRFYQIENKLDAVVRADLSKQIPLAP